MNNNAPRMPKVTPMPPPPQRPNREAETVYSEEALRVAQRHIDQVDQINRLGVELDEWRRRALMGEAEVKRLEKREQDLTDAIERQQEKLMNERDSYRNRLNSLVAQFEGAGAVILRCLDAARHEGGPQVNLTALANEIDPPQQPVATDLFGFKNKDG
jgi:FtsZ-binding cell division protein ZapB